MTVTRTSAFEAGSLPETMRAVVLTGPNRHEIRDDVPLPRPGQLEVLCKVDSVAICGTDLHIYEGRFPGRWPKSYPFIPGHEWSGTVVEVGAGAAELGWQVGQRVAGTSHAGCGYCRMCRIGRYNLCDNYGREPLHHQYGHYSQGADAQYVVHSIKSVFPLIVTGRVRVEPLVTHTFPIQQYGEALHTFTERTDGALKVLVKPNAS